MFLEICAALIVVLLVVLITLHLRRARGDAPTADLERALGEIRTAQEATKTEVARAQVQALESLSAQLRPVVEAFHSRVGDLTKGLTDGQGTASQALRDGLAQAHAQIATLAKTIHDNLSASQQGIGSRLDASGRVMTDLSAQIAALKQAADGMQALQKDVQDLQNVLRAPKLRGNLGEVMLEELLDQILGPGGYEMQHRFSDKSVVDAAIRLRGQWVPVDAKFPLEAFNRMQAAADDAARAIERRTFAASVRARVDEIATKYIRPAEGTFDFALMYLPAEGIYYEVVVRDEGFGGDKSLLTYALEQKVIPVSPNTLYAYLSTIVMGLKGMNIEKRAKEIQGQVATLQQKFAKFFESFTAIGTNLERAQTKYDDTKKRGGKINELMGEISGARTELPEGVDAEAPALPPDSFP